MTDLDQEDPSQVNSADLKEEAVENGNAGVVSEDQDGMHNEEDIGNPNEEDIANPNEEDLGNNYGEPERSNEPATNCVDTTADFLQIFQGRTEFKSWEDFHTLFEKFQKETGSAFKPKSVTSIEYANERRVKDIIPDHFVYQTVKMVCTHYGVPNPVRKEGSKPRKKYVGLGCEAMVHLRYKAGTLNIVGCNLEHKNHPLFSGTDVIRSIRSFSFSDDIDLLMAKVVMEHNPFLNWSSEKEWMALVADLQSRDPRMKTVTVRVVKKRITFLIDRYVSNSNGETPSGPQAKTIAVFLEYLERKDSNDRRLKQEDIDLRRGELELHQKQYELRRERFEFERLERQAHLDLLKAQLEALSSQQQTQQPLQEQKLIFSTDPRDDGNSATEYTIVVNDDQAYITR
ncbi:transcription factor FAR1 [Elysia marginata]|uniref:Transcription factor FAR1 n=1 Tax=Elysia marginata TaxID=1093978 RepID=A0AAV4FF76_9GAST|nr:transcription factor FAR1 [Elysia marginata]